MNDSASVVQAAHSVDLRERASEDQSERSQSPAAARLGSIPTELVGHVRDQGDELVLSGQPLPSLLWIPHALLQMLLLIPGFFFVVMVFTLGLELSSIWMVLASVLTALVMCGVCGTATIAHLIWFGIGTSVTFGPRGYRTRLPGVFRRKTTTLTLKGELGCPLRIVGDHGAVFEQQPRLHGPWQVAHIFWLAHRMAEKLEVPLVVEADTAGWNRWANDPTFRAQVAYEARVKRSRIRYGEWYRVPATEPAQVQFDPDGLQWNRVRLEKRGLRAPAFGIAWDHVHDAEVEVYNHAWTDGNGSYHQEARARLLVFTHDDVKMIVERRATPASVGELFWLRDQVRANMDRVSEYQGSAADVPEELLEVRQR